MPFFVHLCTSCVKASNPAHLLYIRGLGSPALSIDDHNLNYSTYSTTAFKLTMVFIAIGMAQAAKVARQKYVQNKKRQEVIVPVEGSNQLMAERAGVSGADTWFGSLNDAPGSSSRSSSNAPQYGTGQASDTNPLNTSSRPSSVHSSATPPFGSTSASDRDSQVDVVTMDDVVSRADTKPRTARAGSSREEGSRSETKADSGSFIESKRRKDKSNGRKKKSETLVAGSFSAAMRQERQNAGEQIKKSVGEEPGGQAQSVQSAIPRQQRKVKRRNPAPGSFLEERERGSGRPTQRGAVETANPVVGDETSRDVGSDATRRGRNATEGSFAEVIKRNSGNRTRRDRKDVPPASAYPAGSKVRPRRASRVAQQPPGDTAESSLQKTGSCMQAEGTMKKRVTRRK